MAAGRIGKYERLDVLGHGTSGVVYLAWDNLLRRQVALKEIRADGADLERVLDEARVLDRLRHPNIVHVNGVDQVDGIVLIDMELVRGKNLAQVLRDAGGGPLALDQAVDIAVAVLNALGYAHERRIVHRDVKPANILVADDGSIKLTDFGLAEALGTGSVAGGGGTYPYMAPEDFAEDASSDYRSDLWAVGVVLYEMLAGRRPFTVAQRTKDPFSWKRAIEQDTAPRLLDLRPDLSSEISDVVARALAKSKTARYPTAAVFADALRAAAAATERTRPLVIKVSGPEALEDTEPEDVPIILGNGSAVVYSLDDLLNAAAKHWDEARRALLNGRIEAFLRAIGEVYIADLAAELAARGSSAGENPDRLLREFLNRSRVEEEAPAGTGTLVRTGIRRPRRFRLGRNTEEGEAENKPEEPAPTIPAQSFLAALRTAPETATVPVQAFRPPTPYKQVENSKPPVEAKRQEKQEKKEQQPANTAMKHRWWFWPVYLLAIAPPAVTIQILNAHHYSSATRFHTALTAWASAGMLGAMLLLICLGVRLPALARAVCTLPVVIGLVAAGALASQMLGGQPTPDSTARVAVASLVPIAVLLVESLTVIRFWRLWLVLTLIGSALATAHFGRFLPI